MKAFTFKGHVEYESVKELIENIDKVDADENVVLYITSGGGSVPDMENLVDYLNRNPKRYELICNWEMSSAAFTLLADVKCKIKLGKECFAKIHLFDNDISYINLNDEKSIDVYLLDMCKRLNKKWLEDLSLAGCTEEEINRIKMGQDVILNAERMIQIIKILRKIK